MNVDSDAPHRERLKDPVPVPPAAPRRSVWLRPGISGIVGFAAFVVVGLPVASSVFVALTINPSDANIRVDLLITPLAALMAFLALIGAFIRKAAFDGPPHLAVVFATTTLVTSGALWYGDLWVERATAQVAQFIGWDERECDPRSQHFERGTYCKQSY